MSVNSIKVWGRVFRLKQTSNSGVAEAAATKGIPSWMVPRALRVVILLALFSAAAVYESAHLSSINAPELWVHLRTGRWILENRAVPHSSLFSQYSNLPWRDSSWGVDLLLGVAYKLLGLRAIPIVLMVFKTALAVVMFLLARSAGTGFWTAVAASAIVQVIIPGLQPLPYVFSVILFAVELQWLLESRHSGSARRLWWLPLLFVFWANLHSQFVAGLFLLVLFLTTLLIEHWLRLLGVGWLSPLIRPLPLRDVGPVCGLTILATLVTPYGWRMFTNPFEALYSDVGFKFFAEMSALSFRRPPEYALMLLVMATFLALGRRRSLEVFEVLTLLATVVIGFRIQRDSWMVVLAAILVLSFVSADKQVDETSRRRQIRFWELGTVTALTVVILFGAAVRLPDQNSLMSRISRNYPVKACDFMTSHQLPTPLFHAYSWGSFLTWYAPQYPVVVDNRVELYGDKILGEYFDVIGGKERLDEHPMVAGAGTLLLEKDSAMAKALSKLPGLKSRYTLVYSDDIARVFVPASQSQKQ